MEIEKKDIQHKLKHHDKLLEQINNRISLIKQEILDTQEQMYEIAAYPNTSLDKEGHGAIHKDLSDVLKKYEKLVKKREKELVNEVQTLSEEYQLISRVYLCFQALSGMDYEIIDKLYCRGMPYKAVEQESGLSHSSFEQRRQGALKLIYMLCTSEMTNAQIIRHSKRKEENNVLKFSTQEKWIDEWEQMSLMDYIDAN